MTQVQIPSKASKCFSGLIAISLIAYITARVIFHLSVCYPDVNQP